MTRREERALPVFRPEAIAAHGERDRPRILPPIAAPQVRTLATVLTAAVAAAAVVGLAWPVPRVQRVAVVGLPGGRGVVVVSAAASVARLGRGDMVRADLGGGHSLELRIDDVIGVRTPQQVHDAYGNGRVAQIATVPVGLARASIQGPSPAMTDALVAGLAYSGRERVIDLIAGALE